MWGFIFTGVIFGVAAIGAGIENAKIKKEPYRHLDDGTPVYMDRKCQDWVNGEKIVATYDYENKKLVYAGQKTGKVYMDPQANRLNRMHKISEEHKAKAIADGELAYTKYEPKADKFLTCEISTGKYISRLEGNGTSRNKSYKKFYLPHDSFYNPGKVADGDEGTAITKEEFWKLNINGSHRTYY